VRKISIFLLLLGCAVNLIFIRCKKASKNQKTITGKFVSFWGDTHWIYTFDSLAKYEFVIRGHLGFSTTKGTYRISNNTIYLTAFPKVEQQDSNFYFEKDTLLIESDSCLLGVPLGYEHNLENTTQKIFYESKRRDITKKGYPIID